MHDLRRNLTELEREVLALVASGARNEEIAEILCYSPNYIKDVVVSARDGLGARDRAHAAALAVALGIVTVEDHISFRFAPERAAQPAEPAQLVGAR